MNAQASQLDFFARLLNQVGDKAAELVDLLLAEHAALGGNDPQALEQAVQKKLAGLQTLEKSLHERDRLLDKCGFQAGNRGCRHWLADVPAGHPAHAAWTRLQALSEKLARQNQINAALVNQSAERTRMALDILTGRPSDQQLYQARGKVRSQRRSLSLARA